MRQLAFSQWSNEQVIVHPNAMRIAYQLPTTWHDQDLATIVAAGTKCARVVEIYGSLRTGFPSGRPSDGPDVSRQRVTEHFGEAACLGLRTNYLLNGWAPPDFSYSPAQYDDYLDWIVNGTSTDLVTVSDLAVLERLHSKFGHKDFKISAIRGLRTRDALAQVLHDKPTGAVIQGVVLHHDVTLDSGSPTHGVVDLARTSGCEVTVMVTESCYGFCPRRDRHYRLVGEAALSEEAAYFDSLQTACVAEHLEQPELLLDLVGHLLPEMVKDFSDRMGVWSYKLSGRAKPREWILNTARAYLDGGSRENVFEQIVMTTPFLEERFGMDVSALFYVCSDRYAQVAADLVGLPRDTRRHRVRAHALELFRSGALRVGDPGAEYAADANGIRLVRPGEYLQLLRDKLA